MSSPVIVNSVWNLQKSCPIDHLFDIRTNIPIRDCIDYIRPISWAPAKRAITAKSHRFILWGAITCAASLTNAAPKMEYPDPDHTLLPSGQLLTPLATPGAQQQHPYGKVPVRTAGLAITSDGRKLVVANVYNDSVSVVNLATHQPEERDLRPGKNDPSKHGVSGGEYPFGVVTNGDGTVYVSSVRDREIVVLDIVSRPRVVSRIKTKGNPNMLLLDRRQRFLYVAEDNSDSVAVIDTRLNKVVAEVGTAGARTELPETVFRYRGSGPNSLALSPDGTTLYVTNGGSSRYKSDTLIFDRTGVRSCKALDWLTKSSLRRAENILAQNFLKSVARCFILSKIPCLNVSLTG
jgi:YVTN family beta-propeller protein